MEHRLTKNRTGRYSAFCTGMATITVAAALSACGGGGGSSGSTAPPQRVNVTVTGLSGTASLQNNGGDELVLTTNGATHFSTSVATGAAYRVTILSQPSGQACLIGNGEGVAVADVNVTLTCAAPTAKFTYPVGLTLDSMGNILIADVLGMNIRKLGTSGRVDTLAGLGGVSGAQDGVGSVARFNRPFGIAADKNNVLYVADKDNGTIRKISPDGVVTTLAGTAGVSGAVDATGNAASFAHSKGVAVDGFGNVYVADTGNHTIRKITPSGVVTTFAGLAGVSGDQDGTGSSARLDQPTYIEVDAGGNLFFSNGLGKIRKVTPAGVVTTLALVDGVTGAPVSMNIEGMAVDASGNIFVSQGHAIRKISATGMVTTLAGAIDVAGYADGDGGTARFSSPADVVVDKNGYVYVSDLVNKLIRKISPTGKVSTAAGTVGVQGFSDS